MRPSKMDLLTRCHGGGGGGRPKTPPPPSPTQAAENIAKARVLDRQRRARGYGSTLIASLRPEMGQPQSILKQILGQ